MDAQQRIKKLYERRDEIDREIAEAKCWGALLTALNEERRGIERAILALEHDQRKRSFFPSRYPAV